jgi:RNA polymerase sigma factor (sigma-70 family)
MVNSIVERHELTKKNLPLAKYFARAYRNRGLDRDELLSAAYLGLFRSTEKFDSRKNELGAYAGKYVRGAILDYFIGGHKRTINVPWNIASMFGKIKRAEEYLTHRLERNPTEEEIIQYVNETFYPDKPRKQIKSFHIPAIRFLRTHVQSMERKSRRDGDILPYATVSHAENPLEKMANQETLQRLKKTLENGVLTEIEKQIIFFSFGINGEELTLKEMQERIGLAAGTIKKIRRYAFEKLANTLDPEKAEEVYGARN